MNSKKALLVILDGWGLGQIPSSDAILQAKTPFFDQLMIERPNATLTTYGMQVGLPEGQMGNSEVGHLNIGAGRIVYQELARINQAISDDTLKDEVAIKEAIAYAKANNKTIHLMGLLSDGGVHSHIEHLKALVTILDQAGIPKVSIHAFMDGRDTDPHSGKHYVSDLLKHLSETNAQLTSIIGRYYAMDRDERWERIQKAYNLVVRGEGESFDDPIKALEKSYENGITDEFIEPIILDTEGTINTDDVVIFFNFRTDRPRQLTRVLTQEDKHEFNMHTLPLYFVTMTNYDRNYKGIHVVYEKTQLTNTLGAVLQSHGLLQVRIAETEKYPHVTFFFNGGREAEFEGEDRILIPSPKVATYDLAPEMSAIPLTEAICSRIESNAPDFICLNYANADMVGHTGDFNAAMKACETVDSCLRTLVDTALKKRYEIIVIADHGNSDYMINEDGSPNTAHSTNPVPVIYISSESQGDIRKGKLADIAPTILYLMGIPIPEEMTGNILVQPSIIAEIKKKAQLVAVSKTKPIHQILDLYNRGILDFGENRVQELLEKHDQLPGDIHWHLIGHLQKNKVKYIAPFVYLIHSVDSESLVKTIQKQAVKNNRQIPILLQIKIAKEDSKYGLTFENAKAILSGIAAGIYPNVELKGFMGMATFTDDMDQVRQEFRSLKSFQLECIQSFPSLKEQLQELSMGMSGDYGIAIEEGATMVRVGSKIFGAR